MKILSPAGNFECLKAAIFNGADEVYLGINEFNARNNIDGFTMANLKDAVDFCHIYGVKVCLAINILFTDLELQDALDIIVKAYNLGVDAFIIQDLGLIKLMAENYPKIELHASTQMAIHNLEGALYLKQFGIKRIVLARETPLDEIKRIKQNTDFEIEYFAQGALCVSFSGNCYLSSYLFNASGNRGRCKQLCRLPYTLCKNGKSLKKGYLLSAKDFNMIEKLDALLDAGVDVLKIEGRARRPFYVATATKEYKKALDGKKTSQDNLKLAFNREYTAGYFDGNGKIISNLQNHIGIFIGKVEKVNKGKNFNQVYFYSNRNLSPKSSLKVFNNGTEKSVLTAYDLKNISSGKYMLTTTQNLAVGDSLNLIIDAELENKTLSATLKRMVDLKIWAYANAKIKATAKLGGAIVEVFGEILDKAQKIPLSIEDLALNFAKSEYFEPNITEFNTDGVFIQKSKLNEFRRTVYDSLYNQLITVERVPLKAINICSKKPVKAFIDFEFINDTNCDLTAKNIVYSPEVYELDKVLALKKKCLNQGKKLYLDTPNFALKKDIELLKDLVEKTGVGIIANNYYALKFNTEIIIGGGLNVYNSVTASHYNKPIISAEDGVLDRTDFAYMTLRHCPIKNHIGGDCNNCKYSDGYLYKMDSGKELKLKRKKLSTCTFYLV
ncbi:MAG: U32 family peptidase [Clostridiales bacterium]|nr:U32 family peptidase [Clostridiales bacterium]